MTRLREDYCILWFGVSLERREHVFRPVSAAPGRAMRSRSRRSTYHQASKNIGNVLISTRNSVQLSEFLPKTKKDLGTKLNKSLSSFSRPSLSSYGMPAYDDKFSSKMTKHRINSALNMPHDRTLLNVNILSHVIRQDLEQKPTAVDLLEEFVKDKILHRPHVAENNTDYDLKKMYESCIVNCNKLNSFLSKDVSFLPDYLKEVVAAPTEIQVTMSSINDAKEKASYKFLDESQKEGENFDVDTSDGIRHYLPKNDVTTRIINDNMEFKRFFQPLLLAKVFGTAANTNILHTVDKDIIQTTIDHLTTKLYSDFNKPDSECRTAILAILKSSKFNLTLLRELSLQVDFWYDALLKGLFSQYQTVVEDTCIIIAFICFQPILAAAIINHHSFDVGRDTAFAILRAMEMKPAWFSTYSFTLGFIIGCCHRFSILEVLYERVHISRRYVVLAKWANFVFYAALFWKSDEIAVKHQIVIKIIEYLEFCLLKNLSHFEARRALILYSKRCSFPCKSVTIWPGTK